MMTMIATTTWAAAAALQSITVGILFENPRPLPVQVTKIHQKEVDAKAALTDTRSENMTCPNDVFTVKKNPGVQEIRILTNQPPMGVAFNATSLKAYQLINLPFSIQIMESKLDRTQLANAFLNQWLGNTHYIAFRQPMTLLFSLQLGPKDQRRKNSTQAKITLLTPTCPSHQDLVLTKYSIAAQHPSILIYHIQCSVFSVSVWTFRLSLILVQPSTRHRMQKI
jgi:hypothetical protein